AKNKEIERLTDELKQVGLDAVVAAAEKVLAQVEIAIATHRAEELAQQLKVAQAAGQKQTPLKEELEKAKIRLAQVEKQQLEFDGQKTRGRTQKPPGPERQPETAKSDLRQGAPGQGRRAQEAGTEHHPAQRGNRRGQGGHRRHQAGRGRRQAGSRRPAGAPEE